MDPTVILKCTLAYIERQMNDCEFPPQNRCIAPAENIASKQIIPGRCGNKKKGMQEGSFPRKQFCDLQTPKILLASKRFTMKSPSLPVGFDVFLDRREESHLTLVLGDSQRYGKTIMHLPSSVHILCVSKIWALICVAGNQNRMEILPTAML